MAERVDWISVVLVILSLPVRIVLALLRLPADLRRVEAARRGVVTCSSGHVTTLMRMARCPVCAAVKPTNVLLCPVCKTSFAAVTCSECGETVFI